MNSRSLLRGTRRALPVSLAAALLTLGLSLPAASHAGVFVEQTRWSETFIVTPSKAAEAVCMRPAELYVYPSCEAVLTIHQSGETLFERKIFWSEYGSEYETRLDYGLSGAHTGKLRWRLLVTAQEGSGWSQEVSGGFGVPGCVREHRTYMLSGRARQATLRMLRGEYVSSVRCKGWSRRWGIKRCVAVYSRSYRTCIGVFHTREYEWGEFGNFYSRRTARLNKRRCFY